MPKIEEWKDVPSDEIRCSGKDLWEKVEAQEMGVPLATFLQWRIVPEWEQFERRWGSGVAMESPR